MAAKTPTCEEDCKQIHDSWGSLSHLASRTQEERRQIRETYSQMYGNDLLDCLQKNEPAASPRLCSVLSLWLLDPVELDAALAMEALDHRQGFVNYRTLVEIFAGRKSTHVALLKQAYQKKFRRQLDQDIVSAEPPHPFQKILMALGASHKAHQADFSQHVAQSDARRLYQTGEGKPGAIDGAVVLEILSKRSIPQLKLTLSTYKRIYGHDYTKSLKTENHGEFEDALKVVIKCIYNPQKYYSKSLYECLKGRQRDKSGLARVMISRAGPDMNEIKSFFKKKYGMELRDAISESFPLGDCRDFLVALAS
ncbi:annexin Gh1-like [Diospyros lotus]|uniref:annexin Gh1-like n=1 Tax=Diospyros lotus TaxID=55363 RepID=UPI002251F10A|nr:annexin Gh1-like [Diospyros lotus]